MTTEDRDDVFGFGSFQEVFVTEEDLARHKQKLGEGKSPAEATLEDLWEDLSGYLSTDDGINATSDKANICNNFTPLGMGNATIREDNLVWFGQSLASTEQEAKWLAFPFDRLSDVHVKETSDQPAFLAVTVNDSLFLQLLFPGTSPDPANNFYAALAAAMRTWRASRTAAAESQPVEEVAPVIPPPETTAAVAEPVAVAPSAKDAGPCEGDKENMPDGNATVSSKALEKIKALGLLPRYEAAQGALHQTQEQAAVRVDGALAYCLRKYLPDGPAFTPSQLCLDAPPPVPAALPSIENDFFARLIQAVSLPREAVAAASRGAPCTVCGAAATEEPASFGRALFTAPPLEEGAGDAAKTQHETLVGRLRTTRDLYVQRYEALLAERDGAVRVAHGQWCQARAALEAEMEREATAEFSRAEKTARLVSKTKPPSFSARPAPAAATTTSSSLSTVPPSPAPVRTGDMGPPALPVRRATTVPVPVPAAAPPATPGKDVRLDSVREKIRNARQSIGGPKASAAVAPTPEKLQIRPAADVFATPVRERPKDAPPAECGLCCTLPEDTELKPCGHLACSECIAKIKDPVTGIVVCPWDRQTVASTQRVGQLK